MLVNRAAGSANKVIVCVLAPAAAGLAGSLALPPWGLWPALPLAFSSLAWLLDIIASGEPTTARRCWAGALAGWSFGFGWFAFSLSWVTEALRVEAELFAWLIPFVALALPAGLALFWAAAAAIAMRWWTPRAEGLLMLAASLSTAEWLRGHLLTGFPWNLPGYAAYGSEAIAQTAAVVGIYGLTTLVISWSLFPAMLWRPRGVAAPALAAATAATLAACWIGGTWRMASPGPGTHSDITVSIIQASIPQSIKWQQDRRAEILSRYLDLTVQAGMGGPTGRRIIVWPETALPYLLAELPHLRDRVATALPTGGVLLFGAIRREAIAGEGRNSFRIYNSLLVMGKNGEIAATYDKRRLVPFGEFLPLETLFEPLGLRKVVPLPMSFAAGGGPANIAVSDLPRFAPMICYEAIFPLAAMTEGQRQEWLVNITNDAWFGMSAGPEQHLVHARFRAIEEGMPLVRAANTGISAVVDARGRVLDRLDTNAVGIITALLPRPESSTPYGRFGDLLFAAVLAVVIGVAGLLARYPFRDKLDFR